MREKLIHKINKYMESSGKSTGKVAAEIGIAQSELWYLLNDKRIGRIDTWEKIQKWRPKRIKEVA